MTCSRHTKIAITVATVLALSACGSSDDDDNFVSAALNQDDPAAETPVVEDTPVVTNTPDTPVVADTPVVSDSGTTTTDDDAATTDDSTTGGTTNDDSTTDGSTTVEDGTTTITDATAMFGPAQFITSECGSVPVTATAANNSLNSPPELFVNQVVQGQLVPGSTTDNFHVWQISLEPGNYHFIADGSTLSDESGTVGITIDSLGETTGDRAFLAGDSEAGFDVRLYEYLEIQSAQTLRFSVEVSFNKIHNYQLGIFSNGSAVPSPWLTRCLPINPLSIDTTQSVTVPGRLTRDGEIWFSVDLDAGAYRLDASTSVAESQAIGYGFSLFNEFGQSDTRVSISRDSEAGTFVITSDTFENQTPGTQWFRVSNSFSDPDLQVEFTLSEQ